MITSALLLTVLYWAVLAVIVAFLLRATCGMFGEETPSFRRAVVLTVVITAAVYFTFDLSGYGFARFMQDPSLGFVLPPDYSYLNWLKEPLWLKWHILGLVPMIRYLPIVFALCVGGVVEVILLKVPFRMGGMIFFLQSVLTLTAMALLDLTFKTVLGFTVQAVQPPADARANPFQPPPGRAGMPAEPSKWTPYLQKWQEFWQPIHARLDPHLEPFKEEVRPLTQYLPVPVQDFLDQGGWWLVFAGLLIFGLIFVRRLWKRLRRALRRKRPEKPKRDPRHEDLKFLAETFTEPGPRMMAVRGLVGRLRLLLMAPAGRGGPPLRPEIADTLLEWIKPGLGEILSYDYPRVRIWGQQYSFSGFQQAFRQHVPVAGKRGQRSRWLLVAGTTAVGRQTIHVGLAVMTEERNSIGFIDVPDGKWHEIIDMLPTPAAALAN